MLPVLPICLLIAAFLAEKCPKTRVDRVPSLIRILDYLSAIRVVSG